jgi:ATP-dependent RNA helicase DDX31/DBP7
VLQLRGLNEITALSLSATLSTAAGLCPALTQEGETKPSGKAFLDGRAEAFTIAIQNRLEQCVIQDDLNYKANIERKKKDAKQRKRVKNDVAGPLLSGARQAFSAFIRAYPAKEKAVRHIFNARGLHLGHIARSLALKETPKMVLKAKRSAVALNDVEHGKHTGLKKKDSRLSFQTQSFPGEGDVYKECHAESGATKKRKKVHDGQGAIEGRNARQRMMEQARLLQSQGMEFM